MSKKTSKKDPFSEREASKYAQPICSREFILSHLKQRAKPANFKELLLELDINGEVAEEALYRRLRAMVRDEELERLRGGYFWPAGGRTLVKGKVHIEKGKMPKIWVIPEDGTARVLLGVGAKEAFTVFPGDKVVASIPDIELGPDNIREGRLVEILEQEALILTGRFVQEQGVSCVIPHSKDFQQDIIIPPGKNKGASDGQIVVVAISREPGRWSDMSGEVLEILGHEDTPGIEIIAATRAYNLPSLWPEAVLGESKNFGAEIPAEALSNRLDIRHLPLVTIDGEDAKDFDDAVYCEEKPGGGFRLYVAIADVSYYVQTGSALDKEAKARGNSVYFPGKVIPMLPEVLSNGLCSLNPLVDRLCLVSILNISPAGNISGYEFTEAVMRSHARLTYTKVAAMLSQPAKDSETAKDSGGKNAAEDRQDRSVLAKQYADILPHLQTLYKLYSVLREERQSRGAIDFETIETRVIFDPKGKISHIQPIYRNDAHRLIEECMLCANVATARFLKKNNLPGLYRIHEAPPEDKLNDLRKFLSELGLSLGGGKSPSPLDYSKLLRSIQTRADVNVIQTVLLRSLSQAVYSPDNVGHFGLAYPAYSHFTSPIRRYPDLLVHRQIKMITKKVWSEKMQAAAKTEEGQASLLELANHCSMTERRADDATRDALRWLKCEYIEKHIGDLFEGLISGVTRFGFFVELKDIYVDGLVHVTSLRNDYYFFDPVHHRLVGERSGIIFRLGDRVQVRVLSVDVDQRKIDFELIEALNGAKKQKQRQGKKQEQPQRRKQDQQAKQKQQQTKPKQQQQQQPKQSQQQREKQPEKRQEKDRAKDKENDKKKHRRRKKKPNSKANKE